MLLLVFRKKDNDNDNLKLQILCLVHFRYISIFGIFEESGLKAIT